MRDLRPIAVIREKYRGAKAEPVERWLHERRRDVPRELFWTWFLDPSDPEDSAEIVLAIAEWSWRTTGTIPRELERVVELAS